MNLTDKKLERITKIANSQATIKECEPNVCFHDIIHKGITRRVLRAYEKANIRQKPQGNS